MSYCRWSEGDLYVFESDCGFEIHTEAGDRFVLPTAAACADKITELIAAGFVGWRRHRRHPTIGEPMSTDVKPRPAPEHRLAPQPRTASHDSIVALDMFSGCGGSSEGIEAAGIDVWYAANHWDYAVDVHERNHPKAEHFIADLLNEDRPDYYHPEHLPRADVLWASPSCTNNTKANAQRAYTENLSLFHEEFYDADYEEQVTASERSRATAVSVLQYARKHHPKIVVVENTVEFAQWGNKVPGTKRGDGTTFQWWIGEFTNLGYRHRTMFLNSMFFPPCPQSRDRMYVIMWDKGIREPDLDHRPESWCDRCGVVEAVQSFKERTAAWPLPQWGNYEKQYVYRCPSCNDRVYPPAYPALTAIDWTDLGQRIGDRDRPLKDSTMARIQRGIDKFREWPPFLMPAKATFGVDRSVMQPMTTQTTQQAQMLIHAMQVVAAGNTFEREGSTCRVRPMTDPMWSQHTTPAFGVVTAPAFMVKENGSIDEAKYRSYPVTDPLGTVVARGVTQSLIGMPWVDNWQGAARSLFDSLPTQAGGETQGLVAPFIMANRTNNVPRGIDDPLAPITTALAHMLVSMPWVFTNRGTKGVPQLESVIERLSTVSANGNHHWLISPPGCVPIFAKQNGGPADTAWHEVTERLNTLCSVDTTALVSPGEGDMPPIDINDCWYRMLKPDEIQTGMGIRSDFEMHGSNRMRVKALGNAVTPPVACFLIDRAVAPLRAA